jgi:2-iminobutanoate/2-iminopropanoate deaminase
MNASTGKWIKEEIATLDAPKAVGPYNQAIAVGPIVFVSGQIGIVPGTKELAGEDIASQTTQALENIAAILDTAGATLDGVVKTTVYLARMEDFPEMNAAYSRFFPSMPPARATVQAAALPLNALVEIDAVALRD